MVVLAFDLYGVVWRGIDPLLCGHMHRYEHHVVYIASGVRGAHVIDMQRWKPRHRRAGVHHLTNLRLKCSRRTASCDAPRLSICV